MKLGGRIRRGGEEGGRKKEEEEGREKKGSWVKLSLYTWLAHHLFLYHGRPMAPDHGSL